MKDPSSFLKTYPLSTLSGGGKVGTLFRFDGVRWVRGIAWKILKGGDGRSHLGKTGTVEKASRFSGENPLKPLRGGPRRDWWHREKNLKKPAGEKT